MSGQVVALGASEVGSVNEAVWRLAAALHDRGEGANEVVVRAAVQEVERCTEELTPLLSRLLAAVNSVLRTALGLRYVELSYFKALVAIPCRERAVLGESGLFGMPANEQHQPHGCIRGPDGCTARPSAALWLVQAS